MSVEKGLNGSPLCEDYLVGRQLDMEILDVSHVLWHGPSDRTSVDKILCLDEGAVDEQGVHRGEIEVCVRHILGKRRSGYADGVDTIGPPHRFALGEMLPSDPLDRPDLTAGGHHVIAN